MASWNRRDAGNLLLALAALALGVPRALTAQVRDTTRAAGVAPDNTKKNKEGGITAQQQGGDSADRRITRQIRQGVVKNRALSGYAHNVKIITVNDVVTLRGPVRTENEKASIETMARAVRGVSQVVNELTIAASKPKGAAKSPQSEKRPTPRNTP